MQTTCRIDHSLEGTIPQEFCRGCHPELNMSAVRRAKLDTEGRDARHQGAAEEAHGQPSFQSSAIAA
jgi:hypothetical protein